VEKERAAIGQNLATHVKPLFQRRERAPEAKDFDDHSVHQRGNVQRGEARRGRPRVKKAPKMTQAM